MFYDMQRKALMATGLSIFLVLLLITSSFSWQSSAPQVAEDFAKMLGFKAQDMVGKVAPEIKPGVVIDGTNYKDFPGLAELLPKSLYDRMDPKSYAPLAPIKIKETDQYHLGPNWISKTLESEKNIKLGPDNLTLVGYAGGTPFVHPKNGNELIQWSVHSYLGDTFAMRPMRLRLYGHNNKPERELRQHLNVVRFMGCTDWRLEGVQPNSEEIDYVVSGTFIYPKDISGTSYVRKRYLAADRADEFLLYIASMRRVRRMGGRDTQDPLFGSDNVWDDYNMYWQKVSATDFPNDYNQLPAREMLIPTYIDYDWPNTREAAGYKDYYIDEAGDPGEQCYLHYETWQRRWLFPLEIVSKDKSYCYSKRVLNIEPEACVGAQTDMYDQGGRLWRSWVRDYNLSQNGVGIMEDLIDEIDHLNQHRTILDFMGQKNPQWLGPEYADVRFLSKKAK